MSEPKALADLVVGDRFWLAYAQDAVRSAISAPEQRASQLRTSIGWFWTVYSTAGVLAFAFGERHLPGLWAFVIALPSLLLLVAYWQASEVSSPLFINFDPRVPDEIALAHRVAAEHKRAKLRNAEGWTMLASILVGLSIAAGALWQPAGGASVDAHLDGQNPTRLLVTAEAMPDVPVLLSATLPTGSHESGPVIANTLARSDKGGNVSVALVVPKADAYRVSAAWRDSKSSKWHTVAAEVKRP